MLFRYFWALNPLIVKKSISFFSLYLFCLCAFAQTTNNSSNYFIEAYDVNGKPFTSTGRIDVEGSPMLSDSWNMGVVNFEKGRAITKIELQFNIYENELYFRKDDQVYTFADPVREFSFAYNDEGQSRTVKFRNGYTPQHKRKLNSFYQVLADGKKLQLLKYVSKIVREKWEYSGPVKKYYDLKEELFIQNNMTGELIAVKKDRQSVNKALPAYSNSINKLTKENNLDLNSENGLVRLIELLNN